MEKIDRLGWAAGFTACAFGVRIGVRSNRPEAIDRLKDRLPAPWRPCARPVADRIFSVVVGGSGLAGVRRFHLLYADARRLARTHDLEEVFRAFETDLEPYVAENARRRVFVHAGVVGWKGRAVLLPGSSFSGKSTLVAAMVRAGAVLYSDEYAVLDEHGLVHPYGGAVKLRAGDGQQVKVGARELGGTAGGPALPVGLVALTRFGGDAVWQPRRISAGAAVLGLLAHTIPARRRPEAALQALARAVGGARLVEGSRGEAEATAESLLRLAGERPVMARRGNA